MMLTSLGFKQKPMAAPAVNLTANLADFELQITEMKRDGYIQKEILSKVQEQGVRVSLFEPATMSTAFSTVPWLEKVHPEQLRLSIPMMLIDVISPFTQQARIPAAVRVRFP